MKRFALFTAAAAALVYFLDPRNGKRRRRASVERASGFFRRQGKRTGRLGRGAASEPNDATLVRKVESEVFRDPSPV